MGVLERGLEREVASATKQRQAKPKKRASATSKAGERAADQRERKSSLELPGDLSDQASDDDGQADELEDEKDLEPTPLASADAAFDDDADDEMLDLGVKMGKMRYAAGRSEEPES